MKSNYIHTIKKIETKQNETTNTIQFREQTSLFWENITTVENKDTTIRNQSEKTTNHSINPKMTDSDTLGGGGGGGGGGEGGE